MMLEILVVFAMILVIMASKRRGRRRWNPNNFVVVVREDLQLGTLASVTLIKGALTTNSDNEYRAISVKATWSLSDFTAGEGPITVGLAHGAYSTTEVEEWIEAQASMARNDLVSMEKSKRMCRIVGTFPGILGNETLNDGKPIRTKCNWPVIDGGNIAVWAYNQGNGSLTTSAELNVLGTIFGRWT